MVSLYGVLYIKVDHSEKSQIGLAFMEDSIQRCTIQRNLKWVYPLRSSEDLENSGWRSEGAWAEK